MVYYREWILIMLTPIHERKVGIVAILCFRSQGNKAFLRYFYQVWLRRAQYGTWLWINFSYCVIFTYMESFFLNNDRWILYHWILISTKGFPQIWWEREYILYLEIKPKRETEEKSIFGNRSLRFIIE